MSRKQYAIRHTWDPQVYWATPFGVRGDTYTGWTEEYIRGSDSAKRTKFSTKREAERELRRYVREWESSNGPTRGTLHSFDVVDVTGEEW